MVAFEPNRRFETRRPLVQVDPLKPGRYRFQLIVEDDRGFFSEPAVIEVMVGERRQDQLRTPAATRIG